MNENVSNRFIVKGIKFICLIIPSKDKLKDYRENFYKLLLPNDIDKHIRTQSFYNVVPFFDDFIGAIYSNSKLNNI